MRPLEPDVLAPRVAIQVGSMLQASKGGRDKAGVWGEQINTSRYKRRKSKALLYGTANYTPCPTSGKKA